MLITYSILKNKKGLLTCEYCGMVVNRVSSHDGLTICPECSINRFTKGYLVESIEFKKGKEYVYRNY
jgi:uncharacterized Zn finger protein (UPF0148 family)